MKALLRSLLFVFIAVTFSLPTFADDATTDSASPPSAEQAVSANTPPVNINTADAQTIADAHLKDIGLKRAAEIVAYRQQHGPFKSVDDLKNIKGIGQKYIDANRDRLTVG